MSLLNRCQNLVEEPSPLYQKLEVWQKAHQMIYEVYTATAEFPREEVFGVVSQLRRAAVSVNLNIVEGNARGSIKDYIRFLINGRASAQEAHYLILLSRDLGYLPPEKATQLTLRIEQIIRMTTGLITALQKKIP